MHNIGCGCARNSTTWTSCYVNSWALPLCFPNSLSSSGTLPLRFAILSASLVLLLLLLCPHILLGNDANASNCILGLVIYCRSMRIIFTRLPTRFPNVCVCSACVCCVCACCVCVCAPMQAPAVAALRSMKRNNEHFARKFANFLSANGNVSP